MNAGNGGWGSSGRERGFFKFFDTGRRQFDLKYEVKLLLLKLLLLLYFIKNKRRSFEPLHLPAQSQVTRY